MMINTIKLEKSKAPSWAARAQAEGQDGFRASIVALPSRSVKAWDFAAMMEEAKRKLESLKSAPSIRCAQCGRQESTASQSFYLNGQPACSECFAQAHKVWQRERRKALKGSRG